MGLRQLRKWNRKSLLSLASKSIFPNYFFHNISICLLEFSFFLAFMSSTLLFYIWDLISQNRTFNYALSSLSSPLQDPGRQDSFWRSSLLLSQKVSKFTGKQEIRRPRHLQSKLTVSYLPTSWDSVLFSVVGFVAPATSVMMLEFPNSSSLWLQLFPGQDWLVQERKCQLIGNKNLVLIGVWSVWSLRLYNASGFGI